MLLFRIVKHSRKAKDLTGIGASMAGGRWNNKGSRMVYTSQNSSLSYLENIVHFEIDNLPTDLFIMDIEIDDKTPIYTLPDDQYPSDWLHLDLLANKALGDKFIKQNKFIGMKVKSAVNPQEFNFLLNPGYPKFLALTKVTLVTKIAVDWRLSNSSTLPTI